MTAGLVTGKADVTFDHPKATAKAEARSRVEVNDSCNCFKFCFPCCYKKEPTPYQARTRRTMEIAQTTLAQPAQPSPPVRPPSNDELVVSFPAHANSHVSVDVHIDTDSRASSSESSFDSAKREELTQAVVQGLKAKQGRV